MVEWAGMPDGLLTAKPLDGFRVRRANALVAMLYPNVTEKEWIIFVRRPSNTPEDVGPKFRARTLRRKNDRSH